MFVYSQHWGTTEVRSCDLFAYSKKGAIKTIRATVMKSIFEVTKILIFLFFSRHHEIYKFLTEVLKKKKKTL